MTRSIFARLAPITLAIFLIACSSSNATPATDLDPETQTLIVNAERVVFIIPFSHWDTDWHETYPDYVKRSDGNILAAIQMAKANPRFRYTMEQVLFVQHFWDNYPQYRDDLKALVQKRQLTFAWAGITQPETSLTAPAIQMRNLQLGEDWIAQNFGSAYVPHTAWQSDAFGNSAAFPIFLAQSDIPYLFIGRPQHRCDPGEADCGPLPHAFYWTSPILSGVEGRSRALVTYLSYPSAWDAIHMLDNKKAQLDALRKITDAQFQRAGNSKFIFLPMGSDFIDPLPNLPTLVDDWNAADKKTVLVIASPETAFRYLATQELPQFTVDMNPIWQAFYVTRPEAKIADKESEYYLTAADKFGAMIDAPQSSAWLTATMNAHYDNIGAVSFDNVWESVQRPRFEQTVETAANDLTATLAAVASGVDAPFVVFNPSSWARSEIVELHGSLPDTSQLPAPVQRIGADGIAFRADAPSIGFAAPERDAQTIANPTRVSSDGDHVTLANGIVSVTLDAAHGATISSLQLGNREFVSGLGDDIVYNDDRGDVYGSFFGNERARASHIQAQIKILAEGPLIARVQATFSIGGQPITKTVTLQADSPRVDMSLDIKAIPKTTAFAQMPTMLNTTTRTDDLGIAALTHAIDARPIISGDVTYRRKIFYPTTYWSDVSANGAGLTLITQGLQGIAGAGTLDFMLVRDVTERDEGVTDREYHMLRYAYLPRVGAAAKLPTAAYEFNQPLISVWRVGDQINVQLPFDDRVRQFPVTANAKKFPSSFSLGSAQGGIIADLFERDGKMNALVLDYDPSTPATISANNSITLPKTSISLTPIQLK